VKSIFLIATIGLTVCGCGKSTKQEEKVAHELEQSILAVSQEDDGTLRPVEAISAMASVVGERCIVAADEYNVRSYSSFDVGQRVFSDVVNELLCGNSTTLQLDTFPPKSVFGIIRDRLDGSLYQNQFPDFEKDVVGGFASRIGKPEDWGKIPLSLPAEYNPKRLPLRVAFECRSRVEGILKSLGKDKKECLRISTIALTMMLVDVGDKIDRKAALTLALETINGMAKTAPMKDEAIDSPSEAMKEAQHNVIKIGHKK
jgi:hypothetical protein